MLSTTKKLLKQPKNLFNKPKLAGPAQHLFPGRSNMQSDYVAPRKGAGFTLIEVVIVLAIAGLIFVIVLLAVSQAQTARRNTQRKNDLNRISAQLEQYASNNQGSYPSESAFTNSSSTFRQSYINNIDLNDPSTGASYSYQANIATCSSEGTVMYDLTGRQYTLRMCLEGGAFTDIDNQ